MYRIDWQLTRESGVGGAGTPDLAQHSLSGVLYSSVAASPTECTTGPSLQVSESDPAGPKIQRQSKSSAAAAVSAKPADGMRTRPSPKV
jgi:hypothetical protein